MPKNQARSDDEYNLLQRSVINKVNINNAADVYPQAKKLCLEQIKKLDVGNIREIENFYLTALELLVSSKYLLARNEQIEPHELGPDKLFPFLIAQFKANLAQHYFSKIILIENKYKPGLQEWAQLHSNLLAITKGLYEEPKIVTLTQVIEGKTCSLRKNASFFEKDKVNQLIANIEKSTQSYLIDRNEDKFTKAIIEHVNATRALFKKQPKWQQILDDIANTIIQLFNKAPLQTDFSFFASPVTKENLNKLETLLKPKC